MEETLNAQIVDTFLGLSDQSVLTFRLQLRCMEDQVVSFGQTNLELMDNGQVVYTELTNIVVGKILRVLERRSWESLKGVSVRLKLSPEGRILMLGHFLKDRWFSLDDEIKAFQEKVSSSSQSTSEGEIDPREEVRSESSDVNTGHEGDNEKSPRRRSRRASSRCKQKSNSS